jgi:gamma-glutamylcysteine synthetase
MALSEVAQYSMDENAANAFQWAAAIENGQMRYELYRNAVLSWDIDDVASLRKAITTASLADRERKSLLDSLSLRLTQDRPSSLILPHGRGTDH